MSTPLIDTKPDDIVAGSTGYLLSFGKAFIGNSVGIVYLLQSDQSYKRFKIGVDATVLPVFELLDERPLTPEERDHFTKLAKEAERETKRQQHRQQRSTLDQRPQGLELAQPAVLNNKPLM